MLRNSDEYLFRKQDVHDWMRDQTNKVLQAIESVSAKRVKEEDAANIAATIAAQVTIAVPQLLEDRITVSDPQEVDVPYRSGHYAKGVRVTYTVPFSGNREMFQVKPTTSEIPTPQAAVRAYGETLNVTYIVLDPMPEELKNEFAAFLQSTEKHLAWLRKDLAKFKQTLEQAAVEALRNRKLRLQKADDLVRSLGYKVQ